MEQQNNVIEMLLLEKNESIINFFKVLTKKFNMKVKYATNTEEFVELVKNNDFENVICNIDLSYKFEGLFISNLYNNVKKIRNFNGNMFLLSNRTIPKNYANKIFIDGLISINFKAIYEFLEKNYDFRYYHNALSQSIVQKTAISIS